MTNDGMPTRTGRGVRGQAAAARRALIIGVIAIGLLGAVYLVGLWTRAGQQFEDSVLAGAELGVGGPGEQRATHLLGVISVYSLAIAMVVVLVIGRVRRRGARGYAGVGVVVASVITVEILKWLVHRPILLESGQRREDQSFPSGHVAVAMSVMCALVMVAPLRFRGLVALVTAAWATAIGVAAVTASMHRPSDIVGSHLIVVLYAGVAITVLVRAGPPEPASPPGSASGRAHGAVVEGVVVGLYCVVGLVAIGVAAVNGANVLPELARTGEAVGSPAALTAGQGIALASGVAVTVTVLRLLRKARVFG